MNVKFLVVLLAIFGALYFGYPKYQDKKIAEEFRIDLKKPINVKTPPGLESQMSVSIENRYPIIDNQIRLKNLKKSDYDQVMIGKMKTVGFVESCEAFYEMGKETNEHGRKMLAKIVKEDQMQIAYTVKDKTGDLIYEDKRLVTDCPNFSALEGGDIPYVPAPLI